MSHSLKPAPFQLDASQFIYERDNSMMFSRVGSGKTLTYLMAIQDFLESGTIKRAMVLPPLRVAKLVWRQEAEKWKIPLTFSLYTGEQSRAERDAALKADTDILLVNHDNVQQVLEQDHGCDGLFIDELSKFRNPTGKRQLALRKAGFKVRSGGTGTPTPNTLQSVYGMCHATGLGHLVGRNFDKWRRQYFYPTDYMGTRWAAFPGTEQALVDLVKPYTYVLEDNAVDLPPVVSVPVDLEMPDEVYEAYTELRKTSELTDKEIVAGSAGVLHGKLRQIASGVVYRTQDGERFRLNPYRLDALIDLVDELQGRPLIIAYELREHLAMLREQWPKALHIGAGTTGDQDQRTIDEWAARKCFPIMFLHPQSAGHGLNNLDQGGDAVAWWQLPQDRELYDQLLGRLSRRGQQSKSVWSYEMAALGSVDMATRTRLGENADTQNSFWQALRR